MGSLYSKDNPKNISSKNLKVGSRYRYYNSRIKNWSPCRTLKQKKSIKNIKHSLGFEIIQKHKTRIGYIIPHTKDLRLFRLCRDKTRKKK
jgi:hypothetical protein